MDKKSILAEVTIERWLRDASNRLKSVGIGSALLDAEIILAHTLKHPRIYLHAHSDEILDNRTLEIADARLELRLDFTPIAYIVGHKEFYGRRFKVTTATLIPRPETEAMITLLKEATLTALPLVPENKRVIDVGTGSGCLGITAKLEIPEFRVTLVDISNQALKIAEYNAEILNADVEIMQSDLLRGYSLPVDIILANLPYVDRSWEVSRDTVAEPEVALYASNSGMALINQLIVQASQLLSPRGSIYLEADPRQHASIIAYAKLYGLIYRNSEGFIIVFDKA